jgi:uncharacterized protein YdhG (YjbR/CyaY superfamily)
MFPDHDAYIAQAPKELRPLLVRLRAQLAQALPDAEEVIAYKMPGFRIGQSIIAGYAAFSKQCGLYLFPAAITSHADDIAAARVKATKAGVTVCGSRSFSVRAGIECDPGGAHGSRGSYQARRRPRRASGTKARAVPICCRLCR